MTHAQTGDGSRFVNEEPGAPSRTQSPLPIVPAVAGPRSRHAAFDRLVERLERDGRTVKRRTDHAEAQCPAHDDTHPSLSVKAITGQVLMRCHAGCPNDAVVAALGLTLADLYDDSRGVSYSYDNGRQVQRTPDKRFRQLNTDRPPELYRLAEVRRAVAAGDTIYIVEGEKDVHAIGTTGATATTNPMGAGNWSKIDPSPLYGAAAVLIVADRDAPGRRHAAEVRRSLENHVHNITVVESRLGKDAADHLAAGFGLTEFLPVELGDDLEPPRDTDDSGSVDDAPPLYVDIGALMSGGVPDPPQPSVLARVDGFKIFYANQVNLLFGEPETGKTWIALAALAEQLTSGGTGLVIDLDHNGASATVARLLGFGVPPETLAHANRFRFAQPEDAEHLDRIVADARQWRPGVAVVDSIGELMPMLGLGSNSPDDFTSAHTRVLKPIAGSGAALLAIDHVAKSQASKNQGPTGTAAKKRAIGGVSLRVELVEAFAPGRGGKARLRVNKDRHGGLRQHCRGQGSEEPVAGAFVLRDVNGDLSWTITPSGGGDAIASDPALADVDALDELDPPPRSQRDVIDRMGWGSDRSLKALQGFRARRSSRAPQERGAITDAEDAVLAPRSPTPHLRSAEQNSPAFSSGRQNASMPFSREPTQSSCPRHADASVNTGNGKCPLCIVENLATVGSTPAAA